MRSLKIIITVAAIIAMLTIPMAGSDAETPAKLYFFDADNVCVAEVVLLPGEPLNNDDIPWHGAYKEWYDEDAERVYAGRTFSSGDHIIKAYDISNPPTKPNGGNGGGLSTDTIALIISGAVALVAISALILAVKKR